MFNLEQGDPISFNEFGSHGRLRVDIDDDYHTFIDNKPNNLIITVRDEHRHAFNDDNNDHGLLITNTKVASVGINYDEGKRPRKANRFPF